MDHRIKFSYEFRDHSDGSMNSFVNWAEMQGEYLPRKVVAEGVFYDDDAGVHITRLIDESGKEIDPKWLDERCDYQFSLREQLAMQFLSSPPDHLKGFISRDCWERP